MDPKTSAVNKPDAPRATQITIGYKALSPSQNDRLEQIEVEGERSVPEEPLDLAQTRAVRIHCETEQRCVRLHSSSAFSPAVYPIESWTEGGDGPERLRQGLCIHAGFALRLKPDEAQRVDWSLEVQSTEAAS